MMNDIYKSKISKSWYVIYVRSIHEKSVYEALQLKGIKSSLPLKTVYQQWSDRKKKVEFPLFLGYVFVNIDFKRERLDVLQTDGVVRFITFGGMAIAIPATQMYWLDRLITTTNIEKEREFPLGADVKVTCGPFQGMCGRIRQKNSETRLVVWFDAIMQGVSIDIDKPELLFV